MSKTALLTTASTANPSTRPHTHPSTYPSIQSAIQPSIHPTIPQPQTVQQRHESVNGARARVCEWSRHEFANGAKTRASADVSKQLNKDTVTRPQSAKGAKIRVCKWSEDTSLPKCMETPSNSSTNQDTLVNSPHLSTYHQAVLAGGRLRPRRSSPPHTDTPSARCRQPGTPPSPRTGPCPCTAPGDPARESTLRHAGSSPPGTRSVR